MVSTTDSILPKATAEGHEEEEVEQEPDVGILEEQSGFEEVMVWGHEALPDGVADPYVRGLEEWIAFAEQVCFSCFGRALADGCRYILMRMVWLRRRIRGLV